MSVYVSRVYVNKNSHLIGIHKSPFIVLAAELSVGPEREHVHIIGHDGGSFVQILHGGVGAVNLQMKCFNFRATIKLKVNW